MDQGTSSDLILALETSCDETAVAVIRGQADLLASEVASQVEIHGRYGGVVPEVASRQHLTQLKPLLLLALEKAGVKMDELSAFAATAGPGLATSLMLGLSTAKGLAIGLDRPFLAVNHLEGHLLSPFFQKPGGVQPAIGLIVSGGHTILVDVAGVGEYHVLGQTRDDAAGEAFDKVAKLMGLPYPGGPEIDRLAATGDPRRFNLPRSMLHSDDFQFSFSGLKTAVRYLLPEVPPEAMADLAASFEEAVVDVLVAKTIRAARRRGRQTVCLSGGVSCNRRLRARFQEACDKSGLQLLLADPKLCTDNAAMIAYVAALRFAAGAISLLTTDINPNLSLR